MQFWNWWFQCLTLASHKLFPRFSLVFVVFADAGRQEQLLFAAPQHLSDLETLCLLAFPLTVSFTHSPSAQTRSEATVLINTPSHVSLRRRLHTADKSLSISLLALSRLWFLTCSFHSLIVYNHPRHLALFLSHTLTLSLLFEVFIYRADKRGFKVSLTSFGHVSRLICSPFLSHLFPHRRFFNYWLALTCEPCLFGKSFAGIKAFKKLWKSQESECGRNTSVKQKSDPSWLQDTHTGSFESAD